MQRSLRRKPTWVATPLELSTESDKTDDKPVQCIYLRMFKEFQEHLKDLMQKGLIKESDRSYATAFVVVRKDGFIR